MTKADKTDKGACGPMPAALVDIARDAVPADGSQAQDHKAISVQRPVVLAYLKPLRR